MSTTPDALTPVRRLHDHKRFALDDLLDAARTLDSEQLHQQFPIGKGSLIATIAHCLAADLVWISALEGDQRTPLFTEHDIPDLDAADRQRADTDQRWADFLDNLTPNDLPTPITRTSHATAEPYTITTLDILLHVATHQAHTIAQGRNILRQLGHTEHSRNDLVFWAINRPL